MKNIIKIAIKKNLIVILMAFFVCFSISSSYATYIVTKSTKHVTQMYADTINYELSIDGTDTKMVNLSPNSTIIKNLSVKSNNEVETYYKLAYLKDEDVKIEYYGTKDRTYGSIEKNETKSIQLKITNDSYETKTITIDTFGGYITNTLEDVEIPTSTYTEITENLCAESDEQHGTIRYYMLKDSCAFADNVNSDYVNNTTPGINFVTESSDTNGKGLYFTSDLTKTEDIDGDGTGERVYYYRGNVENNNLIFAGYCWLMVRTNEDGSIKLRYSGVPINGVCPTYSESQSIGQTLYNYTTADNAYIGYMMGVDNQCTSGSCIATMKTTSYQKAHANTFDSTIKKYIDNWYETNILTQGTNVTSKIANTIYCNDRKINFGGGFGTENTEYNLYTRLYKNSEVQYKCDLLNDKFTLKVENGGMNGFGNNALKYPVALLNADELVYAGLIYSHRPGEPEEEGIPESTPTNLNTINFINTKTYIQNDKSSWVLGSACSGENGTAVTETNDNTISFEYITELLDVFPSLSLKADTIVSSGNGYYNNPYTIE